MFKDIAPQEVKPRNKGITAFLRTKKAGDVFEVPLDLRFKVQAAAYNCGMKVTTRLNDEKTMVNFYVIEEAYKRVVKSDYNLTEALKAIEIGDRANIPSQFAPRFSQTAKNLGIEIISEVDKDVPGTHLVERIG